ncbi:hypothetical protein [Sporosarcina limicola]|uniref:Uncharacterized protein n=1 Tax=Sporosarcina limicola TaxID=34101 RepID=A0A927R609_9BACL|nr:hypothetical protein [Sporosarcina limicola]MBE1556668.1 hypothetical protein [Sporosarcina limicola]
MQQALEDLKIKALFSFNFKIEATRASGDRSLDIIIKPKTHFEEEINYG